MLQREPVGKHPSESLFSILWNIYPGEELLSHMVIQYKLFKELPNFSTATAPFSIPINSTEGFYFVTFLEIQTEWLSVQMKGNLK